MLQETSQPHREMIIITEKIHNSQSLAGTNTGSGFLLFFIFFSHFFSLDFFFLST